jgi:hypothetical protein
MKNFYPAVIMLAFLFSCSKPNDDCTTSTASIAGTYKTTSITYRANATAPEVDYYSISMPEACEIDDNLILNADGTYQYLDAGIICSPAGNDAGTWSVNGNTLETDGDLANIESFDCNNLVLTIDDVEVDGDRIKITLARQ